MRIPSETWFDPLIGSWLHTGINALVEVEDWGSAGTEAHRLVAMDIETPGLNVQFTINCVTASWWRGDGLHTVLLDPRRDERHAYLVRSITATAHTTVWHNSMFDIPAMYHHGLMDLDAVGRVADTLLFSRMAWPDSMIPKKLEKLAVRHLGFGDLEGGMELAFKAGGKKTIELGYLHTDIDSPIYRQGAMADTAATLRLHPITRAAAVERQLDHPFTDHGATTTEQAEAVVDRQERVHRAMLRRTAVGLNVDSEYLDAYTDRVGTERDQAMDVLAAVGLEAGKGKAPKLIKYLDERGELPAGWPRTAKGALKATKELLDELDHPLVVAQRRASDIDTVLKSLDQVSAQSGVTGRCHPQAGICGASATGRMSYSTPPLQQFSADARPIIIDDGQGLTSVDWSQIEPVTMAIMAGDLEFLEPFENGVDLYEPIMRATGTDRKLSKVVLLATMYGQGVPALAKRIKHTEESANQIKRQMLRAMPASARFMGKIAQIAETYGCVPTVGGRILPVDEGGVFKAVNYVVQGSAYDLLAITIDNLVDRGLDQHIQIGLHDELVVDTPAAEEIEQVMLTPPPELLAWAEKTPKLRTDRQDMGHTWIKPD